MSAVLVMLVSMTLALPLVACGDDHSSTPDGAVDSVDTVVTPPAPGTLGAPCVTDDDCDERLCVTQVLSSSYCSTSCANAQICPSGFVCASVDNQNTMVCVRH